MKKQLLLLSFLFTLLPLAVTAESNELRPLDSYKADYGDKWMELVSLLETRNDLSFPQKLALYETEITTLKQRFAQERAQEYQQLSVELTAEHSCKGRPSGTAKNCGFKCVERPNENMYTTDDWISFTGDSKGILKNEAKACLKLEVRGSGRNQGTVSALFKYRSSYIDYSVANDADTLFTSFLAQEQR